MAEGRKIERLVCLDLDGTFYNSRHQVSERNKEAVRKAWHEGWEAVLCSGRGPTSYLPTAKELGIPAPAGLWLIGYNGAVMFHLNHDGEVDETLFETTLPKDFVDKAVRFADGRGMKVDVGMKQHTWIPSEGHQRADDSQVSDVEITEAKKMCADHTALEGSKPLPFQLDKIHELGSPNKITVYDLMPEALATSAAEVLPGGSIKVLRGGNYWVETSNPSHDKAVGVRKLAEKLGVPLAKCVGFGDGANDASMLEVCGLGIAMSNAKAEALKAADEVCPYSNDEDGVALELENLKALAERMDFTEKRRRKPGVESPGEAQDVEAAICRPRGCSVL